MPFMGLIAQPFRKLRCFVARFFFNSFFDFVYAIDLKKKPYYSMLDDMLVVSVIFHVGEVLGSKHVM
jgi:hypothetical protein